MIIKMYLAGAALAIATFHTSAPASDIKNATLPELAAKAETLFLLAQSDVPMAQGQLIRCGNIELAMEMENLLMGFAELVLKDPKLYEKQVKAVQQISGKNYRGDWDVGPKYPCDKEMESATLKQASSVLDRLAQIVDSYVKASAD
ncbi:MAG: hypothetical protein AAGE37_00050 [Pseudomonadota bacterium]